MSDNKSPIEIKDSVQSIVGSHVSGDVKQTVNYYLSENKFIKDLISKIKEIEEELSKEEISEDLKQYLSKQKYELQQEYDKRCRAIEQAYHDVLKFGFTDEELKELQQLFLENKHQEMKDKVNPKAIAENLNIREEANKKDSNKLLILAKSKAIQFEDEDRFEKTVEYYELSLKADRNEENLFYYAFFLQGEGKHIQAISLNEEVVEIVEKLIPTNKKKFLLFLARAKQNLAASQYRILPIKKAEKTLDESRKILNRLNKESEESYIIDIGENLMDIGFLYNKQNEFAKSEGLYKNALKVFKPLAKIQPELHSILSAEAFSKLGILKFDEGDFLKSKGDLESVACKISEAKNFFLESLLKYESLQNSTKEHPYTLFKYAEVHLKLGNLLLRIQDSEEAVSHYKTALAIFEYLNKIKSDFYLKQEVGVRYNLEIAQKQMNIKAQK